MGNRKKLSAVALKDVLWDTLNDLRDEAISPGVADSVAVQAREIIRTTRTQVAILNSASAGMTKELVDFAAPPDLPRERGL